MSESPKFRKGDIVVWVFHREILEVYTDRGVYKVSRIGRISLQEIEKNTLPIDHVDRHYKLDVLATMRNMRNGKI